MMKRIAFFAVFVLCLCGCSRILPTDSTQQDGSILIDAGHGGMDGGTVAEDGTLEKNINLAIALSMRDMLTICGFPVTMTRETDVSIHDPESSSTRQQKVSDMHNRLALYDTVELVISIHQNHFSVAKYSGTQVFYSGNHPDSQLLATCVRHTVLDYLQPDNQRELKKATDGIYLLYHTQTPAILVECGFLSNVQEREQLKDTAYQQQMACAIVFGYWDYLKQK